MAIAYVQSDIAWSDTGTSQAVTFGTTPIAGNLVIVAFAFDIEPANTISSVVDNRSNSYALAKAQNNDSSSYRVEIWYAQNVGTGSPFTITVTMAIEANRNMVALEYSGAATSSVLDVVNGGSGFGQSLDSNAVTPAATALYIGAGFFGTPMLAITETGPWVLREEDEANGPVISAIEQIGTGSKNAQWTVGTDSDWGAAVATFKEAGSTAALMGAILM